MFPTDSTYCLVLLPGTWTSFVEKRSLEMVATLEHPAHSSPGRG